MAIPPLPTRGQPDWDDEISNVISALDAATQSANANANAALSDAAYAKNRADEVHTAVVGSVDAATAGFVDDENSASTASIRARVAADIPNAGSDIGGALSETYVGLGRAGQAVPFPLAIPAPDGNPSVGHPSVLDFGSSGWNGYRYWMGMTPYPTESRENPCILASHDGESWEVPPGLTNPIAPLSEAVSLGHTFWADTELVMLDDSTMACYFIGSPDSTLGRVYRKTSTNGVTWGPTTWVGIEGASSTALSPTVIREGDGTFTMWTISTAGTAIHRRTSADGLTWSAPTAVTVTDLLWGYPQPWHLLVRKVGATYWMLLATREPYRLHWLTSTDGLTWQFVSPALPRSGSSWDVQGNYRSSFVPVSENPPIFDVYSTGIDASTSDVFTASWRIGLQRSVDPRAVVASDDQALWLPPNAFGKSPSADAACIVSTYNSLHQVWVMPGITTGGIIATVPLINGFTRYRVDLHWMNATTTTTGNVRWSVTGAPFRPTGAVDSDQVTIGTYVPSGQYVPKVTTIGYVNAKQTDPAMHLRIFRSGAHADDTSGVDMGVLGVRLVPLR